MQKITPFLWFNNNVEEAVQFYSSVFSDTEIKSTVHNTASTPGEEGTVMLVSFRLQGQDFIGLNGGPQFGFTEAVSFVVNCDSQEEVDRYWDALSGGGEKNRCGWLKDKFGLSWQVVPAALSKLMNSGDAKKSGRVMAALMQMDKIELPVLQAAYHGEAQPA